VASGFMLDVMIDVTAAGGMLFLQRTVQQENTMHHSDSRLFPLMNILGLDSPALQKVVLIAAVVLALAPGLAFGQQAETNQADHQAAGMDSNADSAEAGMTIQRSESPGGAEVSIANITDGDVLPINFVVKFSVSGMGIAPAGNNIENTGHHHLLIDIDQLPDMNLPIPSNENFIHFGGGQTQTELTLSEGEHTLQLVFADYRHIPHDPPVMSESITITVSASAPPQKNPDNE